MTSPLYLLDTNVLLLPLRGTDDGLNINKKYDLSSSGQRALISRVSHAELRVIAARNAWGERRKADLATLLTKVVTVDIHHQEVLNAYVDIELASFKAPKGARTMGKNDIWIAACAKAANAILLTTDKDFAHLQPEILSVELYTQRKS